MVAGPVFPPSLFEPGRRSDSWSSPLPWAETRPFGWARLSLATGMMGPFTFLAHRSRKRQMTSEESKRVYARNIDLLNAQDFKNLDEIVDPLGQPGARIEIAVQSAPRLV